MSAMKIKKGDTVKVIAGKDNGKEGKVLAVNTTEVTYTRKCKVDQTISELVHLLAAKSNFASNSHALSEFEVCKVIRRSNHGKDFNED